MKRTWKANGLAPMAAAAMATAPSISAAAKLVGVDRGTLHRWQRSGRIPKLSHQPRRAQPGATLPQANPEAAASWAEAVRDAYVLTATEDELVGLAAAALVVAKAATGKPAERLLAMGRFQSLVKQLNLKEDDTWRG